MCPDACAPGRNAAALGDCAVNSVSPIDPAPPDDRGMLLTIGDEGYALPGESVDLFAVLNFLL